MYDEPEAAALERSWYSYDGSNSWKSQGGGIAPTPASTPGVFNQSFKQMNQDCIPFNTMQMAYRNRINWYISRDKILMNYTCGEMKLEGGGGFITKDSEAENKRTAIEGQWGQSKLI